MDVAARMRDRDVRPGWWVKAARVEHSRRKGLEQPISQMDTATLVGRDKSAIARWEGGGDIDYIAWVGLLTLLEIPSDWEPREMPPATTPKKGAPRAPRKPAH